MIMSRRLKNVPPQNNYYKEHFIRQFSMLTYPVNSRTSFISFPCQLFPDVFVTEELFKAFVIVVIEVIVI